MIEILEQVRDGVNWVVIFYVLFGLAVLIMANKFAGFDIVSIFKTLVEELKDLSSRKFTYGGINMAGLVVIATIIVANLVSEGFADLLSQIFALKPGQNNPDDNSLFMSVGVMGLFALSSIIVVNIANRK